MVDPEWHMLTLMLPSLGTSFLPCLPDILRSCCHLSTLPVKRSGVATLDTKYLTDENNHTYEAHKINIDTAIFQRKSFRPFPPCGGGQGGCLWVEG